MLAYQVQDHPVTFSFLDVAYGQADKLHSPEPCIEHGAQDRMIPLAQERRPIRSIQKRLGLLLIQPVAGVIAGHYLHAHSGEPSVSALVYKPCIGCLSEHHSKRHQVSIDRGCRETALSG